MKKFATNKPAIIVLIVLALLFIAVATWTILSRLEEQNKTLNYWQVIPEDFVVVAETPNVFETLAHYKKQNIWQQLQQIDLINELDLNLEDIQEVVQRLSPQPQLKKRSLVTSWQLNAQGKLDAVFFVPLDLETESTLLQQFLATFRKEKTLTFSKRRFKEIDITEVQQADKQTFFSFILHKNFLIGTFNSLLLDDIIRKLHYQSTFFNTNRKPEVQTLRKEHMTLHFQVPKVVEWLSVAAQHQKNSLISPFQNMAEYLSVKLEPAYQKIGLQGNVPIGKPDSKYFLSIFKQQTPSGFTLKGLIPEQTAVFYHFNFSYADKFAQNLSKYWQERHPQTAKEQETFAQKYGFQWENFVKLWHSEIALCLLESPNVQKLDKVLLIKTHNTIALRKLLQSLVKQIDKTDKVNSTPEQYNGYEIIPIKYPAFPSLILGNIAQDFEECYYTFENNHLVFFSSLSTAQQSIDAWDQARTWNDKNAKKILAELDKKANFSLAINPTKYWATMYETATPAWQAILQPLDKDFFEAFIWQITQNSNTFMTNMQLFLKPTRKTDTEVNSLSTTQKAKIWQATLNKTIFTPPFITKNASDNNQEILVQDYHNTLFLLNYQGKLLWNRPTGAPMRSKPVQVDLYKNNRLQYAFICADRLHLIDRLGRNVPTFPLFNPDTTSQFHTLQVLDLKNTKDYWFVISDTRGRVYIYDSNKYAQIGWKPKKLTHKLSFAAQHFRVQNKDYLILAQEDGYIQIVDIEGNTKQTFRVEGQVLKPFVLEIAPTFEQTKLTNVTEKGMFFSINLQGQFLKREQLFMPSKNAQAFLCQDEINQDWVLGITAHLQTQILDKQGKMLFEKDFGTSLKTEVQYFYPRSGKKIIALTDKVQAQTLLVDIQGKPLENPLKNNKPISLMHLAKERKVQIFYSYNQSLKMTELNIE